MNKKITLLRLEKETLSLAKEPLAQAFITRTETYSFHFCLHSLEEDYAGGFYFGVLKLPEDYPFSPPKIWFITESGRFQVEKAICTTFTHYHKETWSASWNIRTMLTALISFMYTDEKGVGGLHYSSARRKTLAKKSLKSNLSNPLFIELFMQHLIDKEIITPQQFSKFSSTVKRNEQESQDEKKNDENSKTIISEKQQLLVFQNPSGVDSLDQNSQKIDAKGIVGFGAQSKHNSGETQVAKRMEEEEEEDGLKARKINHKLRLTSSFQ